MTKMTKMTEMTDMTEMTEKIEKIEMTEKLLSANNLSINLNPQHVNGIPNLFLTVQGVKLEKKHLYGYQIPLEYCAVEFNISYPSVE